MLLPLRIPTCALNQSMSIRIPSAPMAASTPLKILQEPMLRKRINPGFKTINGPNHQSFAATTRLSPKYGNYRLCQATIRSRKTWNQACQASLHFQAYRPTRIRPPTSTYHPTWICLSIAICRARQTREAQKL
jgi:hypothetical protein